MTAASPSPHVVFGLDSPVEVLDACCGDAAGWERRATRTLNLARMWKRNAEEWERMARQEAS